MGVLTQIAQINMTKALQLVEANEITGFKYLGVVFALGFDFFLFGYSYEWPVLIGIVLVISGVLFNLLLKAHLRQRAKKQNAA